MCLLIWATRMPPRSLTASIAATMTLTSTPSETLPPMGALTCTATMSGARVVRNSMGTKDSRVGV